jgi:hypothetical protein
MVAKPRKMSEIADEQRIRLVEMLLKSSIIIKKISDALAILIDKRETLEEKMIRTYFLKLASTQGHISEQILASLEAKETRISQEAISELAALSDRILTVLEDFLKAARYDLNYLEQYFEHGFASHLQSSNLLEDSLKLFAYMESAVGSTDDQSSGDGVSSQAT